MNFAHILNSTISIFSLPKPKMTNSDLSRLLKSDEIQSALRLPK